MSNDTDKIRVGFYIEKSLLEKCDALLKSADARSRNEFVNKAIWWYIGHLSAEDAVRILPLSITSAVSGAVQLSENRVSRLLFKLAVEMSMMMNVVAAGADLPDVKSAITAYLEKLSFVDDIVRLSHAEAAILSVNGIKDISGVTLNGHQGNISLEQRFDSYQMPVLGELILTEE